LLEKISIAGIKDKKLLSAYFTTLGGVRRDLRKVEVAIDNASKAHTLTPDNYRPCTLLGAIYMEPVNIHLDMNGMKKLVNVEHQNNQLMPI
jgi:Flp pilus assembly protein TadD